MCASTYIYRYIYTHICVHKYVGIIPSLPLSSLKAAQKLSPLPPAPISPHFPSGQGAEISVGVCLLTENPTRESSGERL